MKTAFDGYPLFQSAFIFLRHGETETNRLGLIAGATDVELNETGKRQARAAAAMLVGHGVDAIYCSPMRRARQTADCIAETLGLGITVLPGMSERNWGELEGRPRELRVRDVTPPGAESADEFGQRTLAGLVHVRKTALPLIVAHSGTFRVLCVHLGHAAPSLPVQNGCPLRFVPSPAFGQPWTIAPLRAPA